MWWEEEEDHDGIVPPEQSTPRQNLSGMRRNHSEESFAIIPESNKSAGSTNTLARSKSHTDVSMVASDMSDQQIPYKNNGKATIDRNFFKSMAKMIKANRPSIAADDGVWIEGHAMRVRIDLKFHLLHEKMLACEASNDPSQ